ncbi:MAG TPA: hypothetical protein VK003_02030, partial [Oceanobacillus sp.]|nr:hypothetical protein [Oceanobacillus sp.]
AYVAPTDSQMFTEVFPIQLEALPPITAYRLIYANVESVSERSQLDRKMGGKLTYRLRHALGGMWVWLAGHILTDSPPNPVKLIMVVDEAKRDQKTLYKELESIEEDYGWQMNAEEIAEFVVRGPLQALEPHIQAALAKTAIPLRNARVEREFRARSWVVNGHPSISLSVVSRLLYEPDVETFAATLPKVTDLVGLMVTDQSSSMQGEIIKVVGTVEDHRERLLKLTQRDEMAALIAQTPGDHHVLRISSGGNEYDYVSDALTLLVRMEDAHRFDVNPQHVEKALHLKPTLRTQMVKVVSDVVKSTGLIANAFSMQNAPELFSTGAPETSFLFGGKKSRQYDPEKLPYDFQQNGPLKRREAETVNITLINALSDEVDDFMEAMRRTAEREFNFKIEVVRERKMRVSTEANLESAVRLLAKEDAHLMLVFLPDSAGEEDGVDDISTKGHTIGRGQPCLVIHESTMHKPEAMVNVIMGIIARAGHIPYLLEEPLPYADRVVGLSLIRQRKRDGDHLTGVSRIYKSDGTLMRYVIAESPVQEGDGIPEKMLEKLLPLDLLKRKRVVLHYDGKMRRDVLRSIGGWEDELGATFLPVEIIQRGTPRLYAFNKGRIEQPPWGTTFKLNQTEAFVLTSSAPGDATPQPLHIRTEPPLSIDEAIHSTLIFILFHYGALKRPKLPVTVHHADIIENGALRGVLPSDIEGDVPFWL